MSKITLIVNATPNPNEKDALEYYTKYASAILKKYNGTLVGKYNNLQNITNDKTQVNTMIMEFEDDTIIQALSEGEEYQKLIPYRDKAFTKISISFFS